MIRFFPFLRSRGASVRDMGTLRTAQYDLKLLNEPQFVGSFEDDYFVYFVYREIAVEHMNCGNVSIFLLIIKYFISYQVKNKSI